jgi:hypothetical protein
MRWQLVDWRTRKPFGAIRGAATAKCAQKKRPHRSDQAAGKLRAALPGLHGWENDMAV